MPDDKNKLYEALLTAMKIALNLDYREEARRIRKILVKHHSSKAAEYGEIYRTGTAVAASQTKDMGNYKRFNMKGKPRYKAPGVESTQAADPVNDEPTDTDDSGGTSDDNQSIPNFKLIHGVGPATEEKILDAGISAWEHIEESTDEALEALGDDGTWKAQVAFLMEDDMDGHADYIESLQEEA